MSGLKVRFGRLKVRVRDLRYDLDDFLMYDLDDFG